MFKFFAVSGHSLYPILKDGQRVLCLKVFSFTQLKPKHIVVFEKEPHGLMIKEIKSINEHGYFVQGTNPDSIDSRDFGTIPKEAIQYKLLFSF